MLSHTSPSATPTNFALPGIQALIERRHIFWSVVAHPAFCPLWRVPGPATGMAGWAIPALKQQLLMGCWSPTPHCRLSLCMELWLPPFPSKEWLWFNRKSKGNAAPQVLWNYSHATPLLTHTHTCVTETKPCHGTLLLLSHIRGCKAGQWERHCFLTLMETATETWNKPRISLAQP